MKKTTIKKFITLIIFMGFLLVSNENYAQCIQTTAYGAAVSDNSGLAQGITTCNYTSEYATVTGLTIGEDYVFTGQTGTTYGTGTHVYLTITDASNTVIQNGFSPQTVTTVAVSEIRIHLSDDAACATSSTCHNTTVLLVTSCIVPSNLTSTNITTTAADISWDAPVNVPSGGYDYYYATMNTAPDAATTPSANITAGTTANLTALTPATTYYFWLRSNCGAETSSWSNSGTFTTACVALSVPSLEPFATFLPPCWEKATGGALNSGPDTPNSGAWYADGFANIGTTGAVKYNFYTASTNAWLMSPSYIIPAVGYELKFDAAATQFGSNAVPTTPWELDDFVEVLISDGTTGWTVLYTYNSNNSPLNTGSVNIIDLSAYSGQTVRFAYRMVEGVDNGGADIEFFVDNFQIRLTPSCVEPISLMVDNITTNSAELSWTETGTATLWNVEYGPTGFTQGAGTTMLGVTNSYVLSGLTSNTVYDYYVQADCSAATSYWSGPVTFVTNCLPFGSFSENFDTTTSGTITNCWNGLVSSTNTYAVVNVQPYTYFSTPSSVQLYNSGDAEALLFLVTPNLTDLPLGTHRLKFRVRGGTGFTIEVGTITNPSDPNTFTSVEPFQTQAAFIEYIVDFSSVVTTDNYIAIKHGLGGTYRTIYIDDVVWEPVPAAAPACASNVIAVPDAACGNFANTITWDATTGADGYYLSIGSAPGGTDMLNASNLGNILSYSFSGDFNTTYYYTVTPFNAIGSATGCVEENFTTFATGCYCVSLPTSNDNLGITNVQLAATDFPTGDVMYFDHTATTVTLNQAINTNVQIAFATGYTYDTNIWIDLNDNLTFESSEILYSGVSAATNPTILDASFIMPATAALGIHRMRIGSADTGQATPDPCYSGYYGVTLDFSVDIIAAPSCIPPTVLSATSITNASADLAWTESGTATAWDVEWGTNGFVPTGTPTIASSTNPYSLSALAANTAYSFYVRANCGDGESLWVGPFNFMTACDATNVPYTMDFDSAITPALPNCTSQQNIGAGNLWTVASAPGYGFTTNALEYSYNSTSAANVWFYTQGLSLVAGTTYSLTFDYNAASTSYPESLKVAYGTSADASSMTNVLVDLASISNNATALESITEFSPTATGVYYFGFNAYSAADQFNLYVDNINVTEALNANTFDNASFVTYPNPVNDMLNISYSSEISYINVINLLGQVVAFKNVGTNSTQIDMTDLSAGAYIVQVTVNDIVKSIKVLKN